MGVEFGRRDVRAEGSEAGSDTVPTTTERAHPPVSVKGDWQSWLRMGAQIGAAALIGFGLILWVAAHWDDIGRLARFATVGGVLCASLMLALVNAARVPGLIAAFLATGGLFALIGQTYQTGADPWQLFAIWAAVGLPWALAARNDAFWLVCSVVAMLGVTLWLATHAGFGGWSAERRPVLAAWLMAIAITVPLSPSIGLGRWLGETRWAFRLMTLLTIALIAQSGLADLFSSRDVPMLYWLALAALGGAAFAFVNSPRLDIVLVSCLGLSLDTLLIAGFGKLLLQSGPGDFASFLLVGIVGAAVVAGTGAFILHLMRERVGAGPDLHLLKGSEWPVIVMTGVGALFATLPLAIGLGLLFGPFLEKGIGPYLLGGAILVAAVTAIRSHPQASFGHQLAAIGLALGYGLVTFGLFRDFHGAIAPTSLALTLLAIGVALFVGASWTAALLGAAAGGFAAVFFNEIVASPLYGGDFARIGAAPGWTIVLAVGSAWIFWRSNVVSSVDVPSIRRSHSLAASESRLMGGALAVALLGAMATAGPTFLLSGAMGMNGFGSHRHLVTGIDLSWSALSPLSALLALAGCALLLVPRPRYQTALGFGAAAVVVALSAVMPSLGAPVLLLCVAIVAGKRVLAIGAFVAALWIIGSFYYWLGWPLAAKAALMLGAGLGLGLLCLATGLRRPSLGLRGNSAAPALLARGLVIAGAVAAGGLALQSIASNEAVIASGRKVYLALAPVDPRSLIQGDYMRLNFAVPADFARSRTSRDTSGRRWAIATVDDRDVATIDRVEDTAPTTVAERQIVLPMRPSQGRWVVGTDAWYFKEGTAATWQAAKFGIFRVGANGTALLVGMADKDLVEIKS